MGTLLTGVKTEESFGLSVPGTSQKEHVLAGGGKLSELIKSKTLSLSSDDSVSGCGGELEGYNSESFWDIEESGVVGDCSDDSNNAFELVIFELGIAVVTECFGDA